MVDGGLYSQDFLGIAGMDSISSQIWGGSLRCSENIEPEVSARYRSVTNPAAFSYPVFTSTGTFSDWPLRVYNFVGAAPIHVRKVNWGDFRGSLGEINREDFRGNYFDAVFIHFFGVLRRYLA